ncbi:MAG: ribosome biogenesis GTP-binding protein YihA/YsxC [candidate division KSB1 bacterium]|nr:ribosome biogenesis GTP-binding protein YihA/YsxC [candidate division KSB1 bacterium]
MKITSAQFVRSVADVQQLPRDGLPEIAFAGRSNVGKSRLINCLLNRKNLAQISSTPGKTRHLNYYRINNRFYFVDLPGYGYAKASRAEKKQWAKLIESFLTTSVYLKGVIVIIDSRHLPTESDQHLLRWLQDLRRPALVVATKADKMSTNKLNTQLAQSLKQLTALGVETIIPFSALTGLGKRELWRKIEKLLG